MNHIRTLVVNHSTHMTGAPIALLRVMRWCVDHDIVNPTFLLRDSHELVTEFEALGPTYLMSEQTERRLQVVLKRTPCSSHSLTAIRATSDFRLRRLCRRRKIQAIYANTATQTRIVAALKPLGLPVITHVHELERELRRTIGLSGIATVVDHSDLLIAVSAAVRQMLLAHGAREAQIVDVSEPINSSEIATLPERNAARRTVLNVEDDTVVVVACGLPSWRKGTDAFLRVAQHVISNMPAGTKVAFRWIGGNLPNLALTTLIDDIEQLGLGNQVAVVYQRSDADRIIAAADVFISTSREDPNPLVVLEAAAVGLPIVCFQGSGGAEELAIAGGAIAVPYLDAKIMASVVLKLIQSPEERLRLSKTARRIVIERNAPQVVAKKVAMALQGCVNSYGEIDRVTLN